MCVGQNTFMSEIKLINLKRVISLLVYEKITEMLKSRFKSDNLNEILSKFQLSKKRFFLLYFVLAAQIVEIFLKNYFSITKQHLEPPKQQAESPRYSHISSSIESINLKRKISDKPVIIENFLIENDSNRNFRNKRIMLDFQNR